MSATYSPRRDLNELLQMGEKLADYLLGDALYMPLSGGFFRAGGAPQLTTGAYLLRRRRLTQLRDHLNASQRRQLDAALSEHDALQAEWRLHYEKKLRGEFQSRLKLIYAFFHDCREMPAGCAGNYPVEAMRRTLIQEILLAYDEFDYDKRELLPMARHCDDRLRRLVKRGDFIWEDILRPVYPRDAFWWLYGRPDAAR